MKTLTAIALELSELFSTISDNGRLALIYSGINSYQLIDLRTGIPLDLPVDSGDEVTFINIANNKTVFAVTDGPTGKRLQMFKIVEEVF